MVRRELRIYSSAMVRDWLHLRILKTRNISETVQSSHSSPRARNSTGYTRSERAYALTPSA